MSDETAQLTVSGRTTALRLMTGTEGEQALDVRELRNQTGLITYDPGYGNTGSTESAITFIDGEKGILHYRGIPIEQIAENASFLETAYLLIFGKLPNTEELRQFTHDVSHHTLVHEDIRKVVDAYPASTHPMAILSSTVCSLSSFYPESMDLTNREIQRLTMVRMIAKLPTIAAFSFRKLKGRPYVFPRLQLEYCENLYHMMFGMPDSPIEVDSETARVLNLMFILHADHEQNCSTSTVRLVGSAETNLFATIAAGICALWGPLHGGANEAVVKMLERIHIDGGNVDKAVAAAKDKTSGFRLMGFGHRVYKNFDPRAKLIKAAADRLLNRLKRPDPLLDIAKKLEEVALADSYFIERKLYPNVDFYSGVIYRAIGVPMNMFTVMFALGRLPGWIAHWKEMLETPGRRIGRPRQIYTGQVNQPYRPIHERT